MEVEQELAGLQREYGFGVQRIGLSRWHDAHGKPDQLAFVAVTTLEGTHLLVQLTTRGWQILGEGEEDAALSEERFRKLREVSAASSSNRYYETMQALLTSTSPRYRQAFHERLLTQLSAAFPQSE